MGGKILIVSAMTLDVVMPGLVPGIHVFASLSQPRRGLPGQPSQSLRAIARPAMTIGNGLGMTPITFLG
jgi:hypothetical protein